MTSRYSAVTLDLSRFPPPLAIRGIDFSKIFAERLASLKARFEELGVPYDVQTIEGDPGVRLQRTDAWRELMAYAAINDAVRAGLVAFAIGSDLEHLAAFFGLQRRVITPASGGLAAVMETDAELRRRALLAPEAFAAAGPQGAYVFHALNADVRVLNADVWSPAPGAVEIAIQSREGDGAASVEVIEAVRRHMHRPDIKPLTDTVVVRSVVNVPYAIQYVGYCLPGPDPQSLKALVEEGLLKEAASRRTPARDMPRSELTAAGSVDPLDKFTLLSPASDIAMGYGEVAVLTGISGEVVTYGG